MKDIEKSLAEQLSHDNELTFRTSDDEFFKHAAITANNRQGTKDLVALGLASIWVVFISLFIKILKPVFKQMATTSKTTSTNTTNNERK
jgi:hypothetical protein